VAASSTLSGSWTGRYDYDNIAFGTPVSFDVVLAETGATLRGETIEPNSYQGQINATATRIAGQWHFPQSPNVKGTFLLARTAQSAVRTHATAELERVFED